MEVSKEERPALHITSLGQTVNTIMAMVLADIPIPAARESVISSLKEVTFRGSHGLLTTASVVELCGKMESDQWFRHVVLEATERLTLELTMRGWSEGVMVAINSVIRLRYSYKEDESMIDKRVTAPLRPSVDNFSDVLLSNAWLVTIYLFTVTGSIHAITAISQSTANQGE